MKTPETQPTSGDEPASVSKGGKFNFWRWFWIGTIPVSLVWVWYDFYVPANHIAWAKDLPSARQEAARSGKPILVFFTGTWCVPCRIMKRTVWADSAVESEVQAGFTPVMIDLDDPKAAEAVEHYHVVSTPTTILTDPKGNIVKRAEGGMGKTEFLGWIRKAK